MSANVTNFYHGLKKPVQKGNNKQKTYQVEETICELLLWQIISLQRFQEAQQKRKGGRMEGPLAHPHFQMCDSGQSGSVPWHFATSTRGRHWKGKGVELPEAIFLLPVLSTDCQ